MDHDDHLIDVDELATKFVGAKAPALELTGLDGKPIELDPAKPVLLHFWDYRGDKLEEPYGQVGYISFLQGKREKLGMQIVGVAVDKGLGENGQAVRRHVGKTALNEQLRLRTAIVKRDRAGRRAARCPPAASRADRGRPAGRGRGRAGGGR